MLTESWLSDEILNAEINIPNFDIFRGDRCDRFRGGSAAYFRQNLNCRKESSFSNSTVDILTIKCKKLDTIYMVVYRPPDTCDSEWSEAINYINDTIDTIQANGGYNNIVISGDFNFSNLTWDRNILKIELNLSRQQQMLAQLLSKYDLFNMV